VAWTLKFSDNFTDTDGVTLPTHDATWSNDQGSEDVFSNQLREHRETIGSSRSANSTALANDQAAELALQNNGGFNGPGIRYTSFSSGADDMQGYWALWNGGTISLYRRFSGSWVEIGSAAVTFSAGTILWIEVTGTSITIRTGGEAGTIRIGPTTDSNIASGKAAVRSNISVDDTIFGDSFRSYEVEAGAGFPLLYEYGHDPLFALLHMEGIA
jgi:hypothetical protein